MNIHHIINLFNYIYLNLLIIYYQIIMALKLSKSMKGVLSLIGAFCLHFVKYIIHNYFY